MTARMPKTMRIIIFLFVDSYFSVAINDISKCEDEDLPVDTSNLQVEALAGCNEGEGMMGISGSMIVSETLDGGLMVSLNVHKVNDDGSTECVWSCSGTLDEMTQDEPLKGILEQMNMTVPIKEDTYHANNMVVNLGDMSSCLNSRYCGPYFVELMMESKKEMKTYLCIGMNMGIVESDEPPKSGCEDK